MDKSKLIFGNKIAAKVVKKAEKVKKKYIRKFGDDSNRIYKLGSCENNTLGPILGIQNITLGDGNEQIDREKGIVIGCIRMGYGHYRIALAMASAARSMGYVPYWFDLHAYQETTGGKVITYINKLYSFGSKLSQRFKIFNKLFWETLNRGEFIRLSCNAVDQKVSELMTTVYKGLPEDIPFIATHVWPSQAAIHAGLKKVVNAIPDNFPMALHLSEGAIHTVQTPSAFLGYKMLVGMDGDNLLRPIPEGEIYEVGHYVDHEIVANIEMDCNKRLERIKNKEARRILLTIGGAGAQKDIFVKIIREIMPFIKENKAVLFINIGDHKDVWNEMCKEIEGFEDTIDKHFDDWTDTVAFAEEALDKPQKGIHVFKTKDIFAAVYTTNLLMRAADIMITKPSELAFYPVPKLLIRRIGGHEAWGAITAAEIGDGTIELDSVDRAFQMLRLMIEKDEILTMFCNKIMKANQAGIYNGAYKAVKLAVEGKI
ncbi:MAG: hypothetical protein N2484_13615 [Clostridia bacterium]|nr:hypothetical protein [Clostridia bacterium]